MIRITDQMGVVQSDVETGKFCAEACTIGLVNWQDDILFRELTLRLRIIKKDGEGDILYAEYDSNDGKVTLTVFND